MGAIARFILVIVIAIGSVIYFHFEDKKAAKDKK